MKIPYYDSEKKKVEKKKIINDVIYYGALIFIGIQLYNVGVHNGKLLLCQEMDGTIAQLKGEAEPQCYKWSYLESLGHEREPNQIKFNQEVIGNAQYFNITELE